MPKPTQQTLTAKSGGTGVSSYSQLMNAISQQQPAPRQAFWTTNTGSHLITSDTSNSIYVNAAQAIQGNQ